MKTLLDPSIASTTSENLNALPSPGQAVPDLMSIGYRVTTNRVTAKRISN